MIGVPPLARGLALAAALLAGATGCTSDPGTNRLLASALPFGAREPELAPGFAAAAQSDTPRMIAAVESRPEAIALFLRQTRSETSGVSSWLSADGAQILLDRGLLVGTRGFGGDVMASEVSQTAALVHGLRAGDATRLMTLIDGEDHAVTRAFRCRLTPGGIDPVMIGTRTVAARTMTEECRGAVAGFDNYYWVVPGSGEVIQSSQWAGTLTGKISLRAAQLGAY